MPEIEDIHPVEETIEAEPADGSVLEADFIDTRKQTPSRILQKRKSMKREANGRIKPMRARQLAILRRRAVVLKLKIAGGTNQDIVDVLKRQFPDEIPPGYNSQQVTHDLQAALVEIYGSIDEDVVTWRNLQMARTEVMIRNLTPLLTEQKPELDGEGKVLKKGRGLSLDAYDRVLKIMDRQAKLAGLDFKDMKERLQTSGGQMAVVKVLNNVSLDDI